MFERETKGVHTHPTRTQGFKPWRKDLMRGVIGIGLAGSVALVAFRAGQLGLHGAPVAVALTVGCFALGLLSLGSLRKGMARWQGKRVETTARKQLFKLMPAGVDFAGEVPVPPSAGGGDADVIIADGGRRWVIEIKSHQSVVVRKKMLGGQVLSRGKGGSKFKRDPFKQVRSHAQHFEAEPLLWFPRATEQSTGVISGVRVVTGPAKFLINAAELPRGRARKPT